MPQNPNSIALKILGLIPARGGSKGIPGKNIKLLGGKPLLQYTVEAARGSNTLHRLILSSDDQEIIKVAEELGLEVPFVRPEELAKDDTTSLQVIQHALGTLGMDNFDAVCLLQPTTPFRSKGLVDQAIEKFIHGNYDSLISVRQVPEEFNPHWVFEAEGGGLKIATGEESIIPRRQELPKAYHRDGAIYVTRTEVLLQQDSLFGQKTGFVDTTGSAFANLDTPADWEQAEKVLKQCAE